MRAKRSMRGIFRHEFCILKCKYNSIHLYDHIPAFMLLLSKSFDFLHLLADVFPSFSLISLAVVITTNDTEVVDTGIWSAAPCEWLAGYWAD